MISPSVIDMLSEIPVDLEKLKELGEKYEDFEIIRVGIIAELDAINLYEQLASKTKNPLLRKVLMDIAYEEKEHFGEFLALLKKMDPEILKAMESGEEEVEEMEKSRTGGKDMLKEF